MHRRFRNALVLTATAVVGAGLTVAAQAATQSNPTIHACVAKSSGAVRIVKSGASCKRSESAAQWNKTGQRGANGSRGPAGQDGTAGTMTFGEGGSVSLGSTETKVVAKGVLSGSYAAVASVSISMSNNSNTAALEGASCYMTDGQPDDSTLIDYANAVSYTPANNATTTTLSLNGGATYGSGGGVISVYCTAPAGGRSGSSQLMVIHTAGSV